MLGHLIRCLIDMEKDVHYYFFTKKNSCDIYKAIYCWTVWHLPEYNWWPGRLVNKLSRIWGTLREVIHYLPIGARINKAYKKRLRLVITTINVIRKTELFFEMKYDSKELERLENQVYIEEYYRTRSEYADPDKNQGYQRYGDHALFMAALN